jgi:hypothetical protein
METTKIRSKLAWLRDYGIVLLTAIMCVISYQMYTHDSRFTTTVEPAIKSNTIKVDSSIKIIHYNTARIDSLIEEVRRLKAINAHK